MSTRHLGFKKQDNHVMVADGPFAGARREGPECQRALWTWSSPEGCCTGDERGSMRRDE